MCDFFDFFVPFFFFPIQPFAQVYHEMSPRVQRGRGVQLLAATMKAYRMTTRAMQQEMQKYDYGGTGQVKRQHSSPRTHPKRHFLTTQAPRGPPDLCCRL